MNIINQIPFVQKIYSFVNPNVNNETDNYLEMNNTVKVNDDIDTHLKTFNNKITVDKVINSIHYKLIAYLQKYLFETTFIMNDLEKIIKENKYNFSEAESVLTKAKIKLNHLNEIYYLYSYNSTYLAYDNKFTFTICNDEYDVFFIECLLHRGVKNEINLLITNFETSDYNPKLVNTLAINDLELSRLLNKCAIHKVVLSDNGYKLSFVSYDQKAKRKISIWMNDQSVIRIERYSDTYYRNYIVASSTILL